jgi:hypothetical protein
MRREAIMLIVVMAVGSVLMAACDQQERQARAEAAKPEQRK